MISNGLRFPLVLFLLVFRHSLAEEATNEQPRVLSTASNLKVLVGTSILLPCNARNIEKNVRIWKQLPTRILFSGTVCVSRDSRINLINSSSLQIDDITPEYAGEYICQISHHPHLNVTHRISVLVPPTIVPDPSNGKVIVRKGSATTITCDASGSPKPVITWTYENDGTQSSSLPSGVSQIHGGSQLQVASADTQHAGLYRCSAENDVSQPVHVTFNLTVLYAPEVIVKPEWIHGDEGATVEFTCTCKSIPVSNVSWVRGDPKHQPPVLQPDDRIKLKETATSPTTIELWFKLQRLRAEDLGSYTCLAKNSVGQMWKTVEVSGLAEPVQLRGNSTGEDSFLILWTAKSYSPIIEYQLKIRKLKSGDEWTDVMIPVSEDGLQQALFFSQSYNVTGLEPGAKYEAVLYAHNDFGWNRPSETFFFGSGTPPIVESLEETTTVQTLLPMYDAELDITDPTYLKQESSSARTGSSVFLIICLLFVEKTATLLTMFWSQTLH